MQLASALRSPSRRTEVGCFSALLVMAVVWGAACATSGSHGTRQSAGGSTRPVPGRVEFRLDALQISKHGDEIAQVELRTRFSTMPRPRGQPRESGVISEQPLDLETFAAVWAVLSAFDFGPYQQLQATDFVDAQGPTDTAYANALYLKVEGVEVVNISLPAGPPRDPVLRNGLDQLREDVDRPLRAAKARRALAGVGLPKTLKLALGRRFLLKEPGRIFMQGSCLDPPESEWLARALPDLERKARANPGRLQVTGSTVEVALDDPDFEELWQSLEKVDFVHYAGLGREGFIFRSQPRSTIFSLYVDGRAVLDIQYTDRELSPEAKAPLLPFEKLFDAKFKQKLDDLPRHLVAPHRPL